MSKYRTCWENKPLLKEWIQSVPNDCTKAYCKACNIKLYAHRYSVLKHTSTKKHQNNYEKMKRVTQNIPIIFNPVDSQQLRQIKESQEHFSEVTNLTDADNSMQECLLEEAIIEGDALVYNESVDVFISTTPKDNQNLPLGNREHYDSAEDVQQEGDGQSEDDANCGNISYETTSKDDIENMTETHETRTISSHILDTSLGKAAANVEVNIYRLEENQWLLLNQAATNDDGRCSQLVSLAEFKTGIYKLHFNVRPYFAAQNVQSFYPFIEVVVECREGEHYHVPLLLNPFGYSTYRGT